MLDIIKKIHKNAPNRALISDDYDKALSIIKKELPEMQIHEFPTGTTYETWTVPQKWTLNSASVKFKGKEILGKKLVYTGSLPFKGTVDLEELKKHLNYEKQPTKIPYTFKYYDKDWGFSTSLDAFNKMEKGKYEVEIDAEYTDGTLKIGEYIIPGGEKEVLIMVHLDHPYQVNDNLSGVAVAIELAKIKCKHTIRIAFVPETIGAMAYMSLDTSNIEFGITMDMVGNEHTILMQQTFFEADKLNKAGIMAMSEFTIGKQYRTAPFRAPLGADEYIFNDPLIGIPTIFFSRYPYDEYHTTSDTIKIISEDNLKQTADIVERTIEIMETDWVPERLFRGPLFRSKYGVQQISKEENRKYDYFFYLMDGKRSVLDLCYACMLKFKEMNTLLTKLQKDGKIKPVQ